MTVKNFEQAEKVKRYIGRLASVEEKLERYSPAISIELRDQYGDPRETIEIPGKITYEVKRAIVQVIRDELASSRVLFAQLLGDSEVD